MAEWLVLERWEGRIDGQDVRATPGTRIDDTQEPVTEMLANGAALVPWDAVYEEALRRWNEAHDPTKADQRRVTMSTVLAANGVAPDGVVGSGAVAVAQIIQSGQPVATETLTIGGDVYEADGVGANINYAIGGDAAATHANLLAAIVANGTEHLFADLVSPTSIRLRSADEPQGNIIAADPDIALTEAMTNVLFDCGNVNMNTLGGHAKAASRSEAAVLTINAGHVAAAEARVSFPFAVSRFVAFAVTAADVRVAIGADTWAVDNGDVLIGIGGGGLVATDVVTVVGFE
jgi:hypothetical protein